MTSFLLLIVLSIVLFEIFVLLRMSKDAAAILAHSVASMRILASSEIKDDEKEVLTRRGSIEILKATTYLGAKLLLSGFLLYAFFMLITSRIPSQRREVLESFFSPATIVVLTGIVMCYGWLRKVLLKTL